MKFKQLLIGTLFVGLMASCKDDSGLEPGKVLENETTTYVRVSILGDVSGTRALKGYEDGSTDENMVKSVKLTFFDAGRNFVGESTLNASDLTAGSGNDNATVEKIYTGIAQVDLPQNINYPKYVVAYVNPTSKASDLTTDKLEYIMTKVRNRNEVSHENDADGNTYRTMNNSMYFDETTGNTRFATEVDFTTNFFKTKEDAEKAEDKTIDIYVERIEAKVRLKSAKTGATDAIDITINDFKDNDESPEYTLTFVPEAWFVNGTEKRSFLIKNYRNDNTNYTSNMPEVNFGYNYSGLKDLFGARVFNDQTKKRSYWAIDPTYFYNQNAYPDVSYEVAYGNVNIEGESHSDAPEEIAKNYPLSYRSYVDVLKENTSTNYVKFVNGKKTHEYVFENTMGKNTLISTDAKAAMTSVVVLGHYVIKKGNDIVFDGKETNREKVFYVRHEADGTKKIMLDDEEAIDFFMERSGSTFFVRSQDKDNKFVVDANGNPVFEPIRAAHLDKNGENNTNHIDYGISYDDFELKYPSKSYTQSKKLSEQWRTLRVKKDTEGNYNDNIYVFIDNNYIQLNNLTETQLKDLYSRMYSSFGVIERFESGKAYFNVPLKHIWGTGSTSNDFQADNVAVGDYGVVRNHIYDLTINKISGLGTGIGSIDQPIVPPTENEKYYVSTRLNILQWRVVGQSVDL